MLQSLRAHVLVGCCGPVGDLNPPRSPKCLLVQTLEKTEKTLKTHPSPQVRARLRGDPLHPPDLLQTPCTHNSRAAERNCFRPVCRLAVARTASCSQLLNPTRPGLSEPLTAASAPAMLEGTVTCRTRASDIDAYFLKVMNPGAPP